jgi:5-methylcytosine-specific restriction endonuclease McrA
MDWIMKNEKTNAEHIWKQMEDLAVPRLRLSVTDRAIYSQLLRHSRLEGKVRLRFSIAWLGRSAHVAIDTARAAVRRLVAHGALRLVERNRDGHLVEVRLPDEIRGARLRGSKGGISVPLAVDLEKTDFLKTCALRRAIHARERDLCFFCLRRVPRRVRSLDHVVPRAQSGRNSYRNLVSCCVDCNSRKGETPAEDFLRTLYRERRLTAEELMGRLRALEALASGKLPPTLQSQGGTGSREVRK